MTSMCRPRGGGGFWLRLAGVAVSSVLAFGAAGLLAPSAGLGSPVAPRCSSSHLALRFVSFQGATGHRFWQFAFKNLSSKCSFHGFPRVVLLSSAGHVIPATVKHETGSVTNVIVAHGKVGNFTFSYLDGGFCSHHFLASRLRIFPPKETRPFLFNPAPRNHGRIEICVGSERVSPVRAHPDG
jgi:hypothetical protein